MIIVGLLQLATLLLDLLFSIIPDVPMLENSVLSSLNSFVDMIFNNLGLLGFFIDIDFVKVMIPLIIIAMNFEHIYHLIFWVIEKIPLLNIRK